MSRLPEQTPIVPVYATAVRPEALPALSEAQYVVFDLTSRGLSGPEVAEQLLYSYPAIKSRKDLILQKLGARNMAQAVDIGIDGRALDITVEPPDDPKLRRLPPAELRALELAAQGFEVAQSAQARGVALQTIKSARLSIIEKFEARNIVHAIRIAYERGIFTRRETPEMIRYISSRGV